LASSQLSGNPGLLFVFHAFQSQYELVYAPSRSLMNLRTGALCKLPNINYQFLQQQA
jgi:hypothetical protein